MIVWESVFGNRPILVSRMKTKFSPSPVLVAVPSPSISPALESIKPMVDSGICSLVPEWITKLELVGGVRIDCKIERNPDLHCLDAESNGDENPQHFGISTNTGRPPWPISPRHAPFGDFFALFAMLDLARGDPYTYMSRSPRVLPYIRSLVASVSLPVIPAFSWIPQRLAFGPVHCRLNRFLPLGYDLEDSCHPQYEGLDFERAHPRPITLMMSVRSPEELAIRPPE
jgi:hypothetical protein